LVSPGITAMFILGIFWKKTTAKAAWIAVLITLPVPLFLKWIYPEMPFLDNMVFSFVIISAVMILVSLLDKSTVDESLAWDLPSGIFKNDDKLFKWLTFGIVVILILLYYIFW